MTDNREPPPLFDEDENLSRKDDDDIFASAVQSPMGDEVTGDAAAVTTSSHPLLHTDVSEEISQDLVSSLSVEKAEQSRSLLADNGIVNDKIEIKVPPEQVRVRDIPQFGGGSEIIDLGSEVIPVAIQHNTFTPKDVDAPTFTPDSIKSHSPMDFDASKILLDDNTQEISLRDEDYDNDLFQSAVSEKPQDLLSTASSVLPPMGASVSSHSPPMTSYSAAASTSPVITPVTPPSSSAKDLLSEEEFEKNGGDAFISINISDPQKIGEGMGAYMAYKVTTNTNIQYFRKKNWSVTRRFSDFLGLHSKLVEKHLHSGVIIPPAPEKAAIATTKIKLGSDKNSDVASVEFIERRRAALERYMNRTAAHLKLRADPDFREFIELDSELPKATQTSSLSSAGVIRLFNKMGETVNKMAFKMDESDQWFEEKTQQIESLDTQLRKLHGSMEGLVAYRRELAISTGSFSNSTAILSSVEEHSALSRALHQLAEASDRIHTLHHAQADADFFHLSETTKDYVNIIGAVKEVFHERVKTFQTWQHAQVTLAKKRENKAKCELTGRLDKIDQANQEVREWESKVERSQEEFERISKAIKIEMEQFDVIRVVDFKDMLIKYLEALISSQLQIVKVWETFLPEAKAIA